jgi:hypothetical protein
MDTKDCLDLTSLDYVTALTVLAGDLAPNAKKKAIDAMDLAFTRILVRSPYRMAMQSPAGGLWSVGPQGRLTPTSMCPSPAVEHSLYVLGCAGNEL